MNQIEEFLSSIFESSLWPARWHCGYWSDFHGWLYIVSDLLIWAAYFTIPLLILNYLSKRNSIRFHKAYLYFAAFILACGLTHLVDAVMFWIPVYRFNALLRFATAIISWLTVYHLFKLLPTAFSLKTSEELEKEVERNARLFKELEQYNLELTKANSELEHFTYILSHDLREPLRKILIFSDALSNSITLPAEKNTVLKIQRSAERMKSLIQNVLEYASTGKVDSITETVDLNRIINDILVDLELTIAEKKAVVKFASLPDVQGVKYQIGQVVLNLITNGLKYCTEIPCIEISHTTVVKNSDGKDVRFLEISFKDNGIGFDEKYKSDIFFPFKRLANKSEFEGTGIGLALVKRIIEDHKGYVDVESKPGVGSVFKIALPL
ncbi:two-component sensor histidine kinase [Sphingobacteriaceae bacterium]|nr:two-component sensor histidine kinase [Sphingobacteriaceae bacterium]